MKNKSLTVEDVAKEAGVSTATVSRVFNQSPLVTQKTVKEVLSVAEKLNYKPSRVARRLRAQKSASGVIGVIITDIKNPFFSEVVRGIEDVAFENQHGIITCNSDEDGEKEEFYINTLISEQVSGLVIAPTPHNYSLLQELADQGYPITFVDRINSELKFDSVKVNNTNGARTAVKHLLELGHRRIGIIGGIPGITTTEERYKGYVKAHEEYDLPVDQQLVTFGNSRQDGGIEQTRKLLAMENPPTALFVTNNLMTLGCLQELHDRGVKIPDDMALVGFDDMPWAVALNPPLTAVRQPGHELGTNAADLLFKRIKSPGRSANHLMLDANLIVRKSCGAKEMHLPSRDSNSIFGEAIEKMRE